MKVNESIESALAVLQAAEEVPDNSPAIIRLAPDSNAYVMGNRGGYIRLAIASLRAAQGDSQEFKKQNWVGTEEEDWCLPGLQYDENAGTYLEKNKAFGPRMLGGIGLALLVVPFIIGVSTIIYWLIHLF